jgi:hypothetical protein
MLDFVDSNGTPVGRDPGPQQINLLPGQATFIDLPSQALVTRLGMHAEARPEVTFTPSADGGDTDCLFEAEIFDQGTGFTQVLVDPGPMQLPGASPATFSLLGLAFGQVLRLSAVERDPGPSQSPTGDPAVPPSPCVVTLGFVDRNGTPVGVNPGPISVDLLPGQATFIDLPAVQFVHRIGDRAEVRPTLLVNSKPPNPNCPGVVASAETFGSLGGRTWSEIDPGPTQ